MKKKMVIIGAGSAMFTQGLITDLIETNPGNHQWSIALCDIDEDVLQSVTLMVKKMLKAKKLNVDITASPDRREVLPAPGSKMCSFPESTGSISPWATPLCRAAFPGPCAWSPQ